jgi:hypothetical protein
MITAREKILVIDDHTDVRENRSNSDPGNFLGDRLAYHDAFQWQWRSAHGANKSRYKIPAVSFLKDKSECSDLRKAWRQALMMT